MSIKLTGLYIYPIKSAGGIVVSSATVERRGLKGDRRWMVVDEFGKFLTQRQFPQMATIVPTLESDRLIINAPNMPTLTIPFLRESDLHLTVEVWGDECDAIFEGDEAQNWFTQFLGISCQLVYMPDDSFRPVDPDYATPDDPVSFADGFPFLLTNEASLNDLNGRLDEPILMNRFRPNFVISGASAFEEDYWQSIKIGSMQFNLVKLCSRCIITTVDQATGIKTNEPLKTLAKYRLQKGKILFGQNLLTRTDGVVTVGDSVEVLQEATSRIKN